MLFVDDVVVSNKHVIFYSKIIYFLCYQMQKINQNDRSQTVALAVQKSGASSSTLQYSPLGQLTNGTSFVIVLLPKQNPNDVAFKQANRPVGLHSPHRLVNDSGMQLGSNNVAG